ncbi:histidine kinase [Prosthecomicrobium hirschii]|uniref:sensor domain-containing diguanylate cyclase n=1 Tax=Prosthecodimorpha hirschii TaxID=665126 RepID=UPI0011274E30|nr:sensor domain-containing diguanylate cyclase [Prosthecomicrobium hirschii]TPQ46500.1 histidine kinase [Prosthecomicrobium hirschii]
MDKLQESRTTAVYDHVTMFELAPVSLWLEDYSGLRRLFDAWRAAGISDLRAYLGEDRARVQACSAEIRIVEVNRRTLDLFGAADRDDLVRNLPVVFRDEMLSTHIDELVQLWSGATRFGGDTVNYRLDGRRLDVHLQGTILPGHEATWDRVLVAIEDISEREYARKRQAASEAYAQGLFEHSPVSLWVEDFSRIKQLLDGLRQRGIADFRVFTDVHPEFVNQCASEIRVIDVNKRTLDMFGAPDRATLLRHLPDIFRDAMVRDFREQLIQLWDGHLFHTREVVNYTIEGDELHLLLQFSVLPGHERDWSLVQIALTDITARKKAEAYLEYLGRHDVLTQLLNRAHYSEELKRLERKKLFPVSIVIADLNGLKTANDSFGHAAGDSLLRRAGEVLNKVTEAPASAARIGGDEFALLLPFTDERGTGEIIKQIRNLVQLNNQFYPGQPLSFAIGAATALPGESLEQAARRADLAMYADKRAQKLSSGPLCEAAE